MLLSLSWDLSGAPNPLNYSWLTYRIHSGSSKSIHSPQPPSIMQLLTRLRSQSCFKWAPSATFSSTCQCLCLTSQPSSFWFWIISFLLLMANLSPGSLQGYLISYFLSTSSCWFSLLLTRIFHVSPILKQIKNRKQTSVFGGNIQAMPGSLVCGL